MSGILKYILIISIVILLFNTDISAAYADGVITAVAETIEKVVIYSLIGTVIVPPVLSLGTGGISFGVAKLYTPTYEAYKYGYVYSGALIGGYVGIMVGVVSLIFFDYFDIGELALITLPLFFLAASISGGYIAYRLSVNDEQVVYQNSIQTISHSTSFQLPICFSF